jgi:serine/threonine-protein kinase HipA
MRTVGARWPFGAPSEDLVELFERMVFNAVIGNDDDHPRNHAATYNPLENRWRLSPAFDVVPNPDEHPNTLSMQLSLGRFDISREAALADALRFGFESIDAARAHMDALLDRMFESFKVVSDQLTPNLRELMTSRLENALRQLT